MTLTVLLALNAHGIGAWESLVTLLITVMGTVLAVLLADVLSHAVVFERWMTRVEFERAVQLSLGSATSAVVPMALLIGAGLGWWSADAALSVSLVALVVAMLAIGYLPVRRGCLSRWQRALAIGGEAALAMVIIGLKLLAHA